MICYIWQQTISNSTANIMTFLWYPMTVTHMISTHMLNAQNVNNNQILWPIPYSAIEAQHPVNVKFTSPRWWGHPFPSNFCTTDKCMWKYMNLLCYSHHKSTCYGHLLEPSIGRYFLKDILQRQASQCTVTEY